MTAMTSQERVMTVLKGQVPDRIPHFEWIIDQRVREVICPGGSMEEFTVRMGLDAMLTSPDYTTEQLSPDTFRNEWGCVMEKGAEQHSTTLEGPIQSLDDFKNYTPPDPYAPHRYESLKKIVLKVLKFLAFFTLGAFIFWLIYRDQDIERIKSVLKNDVNYSIHLAILCKN